MEEASREDTNPDEVEKIGEVCSWCGKSETSGIWSGANFPAVRSGALRLPSIATPYPLQFFLRHISLQSCYSRKLRSR